MFFEYMKNTDPQVPFACRKNPFTMELESYEKKVLPICNELSMQHKKERSQVFFWNRKVARKYTEDKQEASVNTFKKGQFRLFIFMLTQKYMSGVFIEDMERELYLHYKKMVLPENTLDLLQGMYDFINMEIRPHRNQQSSLREEIFIQTNIKNNIMEHNITSHILPGERVGFQYEAYSTITEDCNKMYIQLNRHYVNGIMYRLQTLTDRVFISQHREYPHSLPGDSICVVFVNGLWYRAQILGPSLMPHTLRGRSLLDIYLVDFGTRLAKFSHELYRLPLDMTMMKPGIICCMLSDIVPTEGFHYSPQCKHKLNLLMTNRKGIRVTCLGRHRCGRQVVSVKSYYTDNEIQATNGLVDVRECLLKLGLARSSR